MLNDSGIMQIHTPACSCNVQQKKPAVRPFPIKIPCRMGHRSLIAHLEVTKLHDFIEKILHEKIFMAFGS
jgi:hypothetical protein